MSEDISYSQIVRWRFLSIRSPWWRVGGSWQGWRGTDAFISYHENGNPFSFTESGILRGIQELERTTLFPSQDTKPDPRQILFRRG